LTKRPGKNRGHNAVHQRGREGRGKIRLGDEPHVRRLRGSYRRRSVLTERGGIEGATGQKKKGLNELITRPSGTSGLCSRGVLIQVRTSNRKIRGVTGFAKKKRLPIPTSAPWNSVQRGHHREEQETGLRGRCWCRAAIDKRRQREKRNLAIKKKRWGERGNKCSECHKSDRGGTLRGDMGTAL